MSTLSVPLTPQQDQFVSRMVKAGYAENKAQVVRKALRSLAEEQFLADIREAEADIKAGRIYYGDLRELAKRLRS